MVERAQAAEAGGFVGLAVMDHLVAPLADGFDTWEAMTLTTWLAAQTGRLRLGSLVLCDAFREPAVLAQQAVTLDHLSGGRFELGLGAGSWPTELAGFRIGPGTVGARVDRFEQSLATLRSTLTGIPTALHGLVQQPRPTQHIPVVIGATGPRMLALTAEYADWWNLPAPDLHRMDELRHRVGAARQSVQLAVAPVASARTGAQVEERVRTRMPGLGEGLVVGTPDTIGGRLAQLQERGVERVYVWLVADGSAEAITSLAGDVLP